MSTTMTATAGSAASPRSAPLTATSSIAPAPTSLVPPASTAAARADSVVLEYQEVFAFFDRDKAGRLTSDQFGEAVRALGHAPTEAELTALKRTVDKIYGGGISFPNFIKVLSTIVEPKIKLPSATAEEMTTALRLFETMLRDRKEGVITRRDLELLLMTRGDRLTPEHMAQFLRFVGCEDLHADEMINYDALITVLVNAARAASS